MLIPLFSIFLISVCAIYITSTTVQWFQKKNLNIFFCLQIAYLMQSLMLYQLCMCQVLHPENVVILPCAFMLICVRNFWFLFTETLNKRLLIIVSNQNLDFQFANFDIEITCRTQLSIKTTKIIEKVREALRVFESLIRFLQCFYNEEQLDFNYSTVYCLNLKWEIVPLIMFSVITAIQW